MDKETQSLLAEFGDSALNLLTNNELLKEIPVLGTSINLIKGVISIRDRAYFNKVKHFVEHIGETTDEQRKRLAEESRKDQKNRARFGDALFTSIEQSDSLVKVEYLACSFEAFLNDEIPNNDLKQICHAIRISSSSDLSHFIESEEEPHGDILNRFIASGLVFTKYRYYGNNEPRGLIDHTDIESEHEISELGTKLREAWKKYGLKQNLKLK